MPANRSRTQGWRRCLNQIHERNGSMEIAIARHYEEGKAGQHLIWRVRLLDMSETEIIVEQPMTLGQTIHIGQGVELVAIIAIGQNRWMFSTTNLGLLKFQLNKHKSIPAMRLVLPQKVERCQRRNFYRVETAALRLPRVELWPLLDPKSVVVAERANELCAANADLADGASPASEIMPEVGPQFTAMLVNVGGGGVGLTVDGADARNLSSHKVFWVRISLPPELPHPICATGKVVHTHMESNKNLYVGMTFDFSFNPAHQTFIAEQICRYIAVQQRNQLKRDADRDESRKSA